MRWTWDPEKNRRNRRDHGISFETAVLVFDDPLALSRPDPASGGEQRWQTVGLIGTVVVLVVHTWPDAGGREQEATGRIISARKATAHERRAYEEDAF
jgi:uncharacterized DUF497 family protein